MISHETLKIKYDKDGVVHKLFYYSDCKLMFKVVNGKVIENYNDNIYEE